jgi:hypothetical protein
VAIVRSTAGKCAYGAAMRGRLLTVLAAASLAAVAPASAQSGPEPGQVVLAEECRTWAGYVVAVACDPEERLRGSIAFPGAAPAAVEAIEGEVAVAAVGGGREPLLPGERLTLSVTAASPSGQLVVRVAARPPNGRRSVVLDRLVDGMTVAVDQNLDVTVTRGTEVVALPARPPEAAPPPPATSAQELAARVVHGINTFFAPRNPGFQEICDALDPAARPYFDLIFGDPEQYGCRTAVDLYTTGDENVPHAFASSARLVSVRMTGPREALLTADLVYRYEPSSTGDKRRIALRARALLRRVGDGSWRLADPRSLLGLAATQGPFVTSPPLATLRGRAANLRADSRRSRRYAAALERRRRAASRPVGGPASCAPGVETRGLDGQGDALVDGGQMRTRLPALGATVDLLGATLVTRATGPPCLVLDFTQPVDLSSPLYVTLYVMAKNDGGSESVSIYSGRVFADDDGNYDEIRFFRGARAVAVGNRLVVRFAPGQWHGVIRRSSFSWRVRASRSHPYAGSIGDATHLTRHRPR